MKIPEIIFCSAVFTLVATAGFADAPDWQNNFDNVGSFYNGVAAAEKDGRYGFVDEKGREIIPVVYENPMMFFTDFMPAQKDGKFGLINKRNDAMLPFEFDELDMRNVRAIRVKKENRWGVFAGDGSEILPVEYEAVKPGAFVGENDRYAVVARDFYWGVVDRSGAFVVPPEYEEIEAFDANGLARVKKNGRWGMVDERGHEKLPMIYASISGWTGKFNVDDPLNTVRTFYRVSLGRGQAGAVDTQLNKIIPEIYAGVEPLNDQYLLVCLPVTERLGLLRNEEFKYGVFSFAAGKVFLEPQFPRDSFEVQGSFLFVHAPGTAVYSEAGEMIIPPRKYSHIKLVKNRFFEARVPPTDGGWGMINLSNPDLSEKIEEVVLDSRGTVIHSTKSGVKNAAEYEAYLALKKEAR
ncbi:WG repeat-containing protein [Pontiella agarivorans]|uniref:WG repeat-containing protein n=1 Tax=Pontiella agarivorans TaxID=3038953 RepID=A0ABU5N0F6_9BACT|nr:WG repeat-containing protein [Pontiella agarivorans]MDZ8119910.1 WG repeat-containing protein [Pontiella agarivorans]